MRVSKSYAGAGALAVASVGYWWSCPQVYRDGDTPLVTPETWLMLMGLATSLLGVGLRHALAKLKSAVGGETYVMIVEAIRDAIVWVKKPEPTPAPIPVFDPPGGGVESLPGGMTAERTPSGAMTIGCLALILGLAATASAAPPKAVIQGFDPSAAGEIIVLDAASSEGEPTHFSWDITPEIRGRRQKLEVESGKRVIVASFPGRYLVTLTVSNAEGHSTAHKDIVIPGNAPVPPTPPAPTPEPQPVPPLPTPPVPPGPGPAPMPTPEPLTGFAADVAAWANAVQSPGKVQEAKRLADACEATASAIAAGAHAGPAAILAAIRAANNAALGESIKAWSTFGTKYGSELGVKYAAGELSTNDKWAALLNETAKGLRGVK